MPKTAVSANFNAHQLGQQNQNDKYYYDKTSEKKQLYIEKACYLNFLQKFWTW